MLPGSEFELPYTIVAEPLRWQRLYARAAPLSASRTAPFRNGWMPRNWAPNPPLGYFRAAPKSNSIRREALGWRLAKAQAPALAWRRRSGPLAAVMYQAGTGSGARRCACAGPAAAAHASATATSAGAARFPGTPRPPCVVSPGDPATRGYCDKSGARLPTGPGGTYSDTRRAPGSPPPAGAGAPAPSAC